MRRHARRQEPLEDADVGAFDQVERLHGAFQIQVRERNLEIPDLVARIVERDEPRRPEARVGVLRQHVGLALAPDDVALDAQVVLVHRQQERIGHKLLRRERQRAHVAADQERRRQHAPHAEMRHLLDVREARVLLADRVRHLAHVAADLQHVHVIVMPEPRIGRQIEVLGDDVTDGRPVRPDVARRAPRLRDVRAPDAGERPAAHVEANLAPRRTYGGGDLRIAVALVQLQGDAAAVVDLDEVKADVLEVQLTIGRVVSVEPRAAPRRVAAIDAAAGVATGVRIRAGLESERMDLVYDRLHAAGEAGVVPAQDARLRVMPVEEPVVYVHVCVAGGLEPVRRHCPCDADDDFVRDVKTERVPARPAHQRTRKSAPARVGGLLHEFEGTTRHHGILRFADLRRVDERMPPVRRDAHAVRTARTGIRRYGIPAAGQRGGGKED